MSQTGPWSVKGIDNRAREAAREAAREEGTTLGAYLNRLILQDDSADENGAFDERDEPVSEFSGRARASTQRTATPRAAAASGEPSTAALDRLTRRIESAEARSTLAITGIDQSVVGLLSRLENAEHNQQALGNHWDGVLGDVQKTYDILSEKISNIEADESASRNKAALRSLEEALGKLATHVYEENELVSEESTAIKVRLETGFGELTERMDTVDQRVEQRLQEASETVTKAVADSQMRVEGTNRHLAERFSGLEANMQNEMSALTETVQSEREQMQSIQERLTRAETNTNEALEHLKSTFGALDQRLSGISENGDTEIAIVAADIRSQFDARFDSLADDMRAMIATTRVELASEIESAAKSVDNDMVARLDETISAMGSRIDATEDLQAQTMEMVGETVTRVTESVDQRLIAGQNQQSLDIEQISAQVVRISESIDKRFAQIDPAADVNASSAELREDMVRFTNAMDARFEQLESIDTASIDRISNDVEDLAEKLNNQVQQSEQRSANAIEQVGEQVAGIAERLEHRQTQALQEFSEKLDATTQNHEARLSSALTNVSDRLERIQEQSIVTISPVQKAIATLAQRIEAIEDFSAPPYFSRDNAPAVPDLVSPTKIDTTIEEKTETVEQAPKFVAATISAGTTAASTPEPTPSAAADEPFEAGYKNWSPEPVDMLDALEEEQNALAQKQPEAAAETETEHDYFAELPPPMDTDDDILEASNEARDSDIFEEEPVAPTAEDEKLEDFEATANPYAEEPEPAAPSGDMDYMAKARQAAVSAAATSTTSAGRPSKSRPSKSGKKSGGNGPAIAAGVALLAVGGVTGFMMMNKDSNPEAVNLASAPAPAAPAAPVAATAAVAAPETPEPTTSNAALATLSGGPVEDDTDTTTDAIIAAAAEDEAQDEATVTQTSAPSSIDAADSEVISTLTVPSIAKIASISDFAESGNAIAQYQLGTTKIADGDIGAGVELLKSAEAQNLAIAQYELANLHISGKGVAKDTSLATPLFKAAAEAGNVGAMHNYATLIADTAGREAEAANWYRRAAEYGLVEAQFNIATMYESGTGVSPSLTEALYWYQLAGTNGDPDAPVAADELMASGEISSAAITQITQRAANWSATRRNPQANGTFDSLPWGGLTISQIVGVQNALNALNYDAGIADGALGATTNAAIRKFQADEGLAQTGQIDNALIEALNAATSSARRSL